jgi:D-amino peptidase
VKVYILADMEGISGIRMLEQAVVADNPRHAEARRLMMAEINAAVDAAFNAGAETVVACDTHHMGGQVELAEMDPRALYETPNAGRMMPALDTSFDALILLGHHARAGTRDGFLDHTMNSAAWFECRINDVELGEIGIEAAWAGHYGVPVVAVTGDEAACREARELFGEVECAVVKWAVGRNRARCLSLARAHQAVREAVGRALADLSRFRPYQPELPATCRLTLYRSDMADEMAARPGTRRIDARTVERTAESLLDICSW